MKKSKSVLIFLIFLNILFFNISCDDPVDSDQIVYEEAEFIERVDFAEGHTLDDEGNPVPNVDITIFIPETYEDVVLHRFRSDENGFFRVNLRNEFLDNYSIRSFAFHFEKEGYFSVPKEFDLFRNYNNCTVSLIKNKEELELEFPYGGNYQLGPFTLKIPDSCFYYYEEAGSYNGDHYEGKVTLKPYYMLAENENFFKMLPPNYIYEGYEYYAFIGFQLEAEDKIEYSGVDKPDSILINNSFGNVQQLSGARLVGSDYYLHSSYFNFEYGRFLFIDKIPSEEFRINVKDEFGKILEDIVVELTGLDNYHKSYLDIKGYGNYEGSAFLGERYKLNFYIGSEKLDEEIAFTMTNGIALDSVLLSIDDISKFAPILYSFSEVEHDVDNDGEETFVEAYIGVNQAELIDLIFEDNKLIHPYRIEQIKGSLYRIFFELPQKSDDYQRFQLRINGRYSSPISFKNAT